MNVDAAKAEAVKIARQILAGEVDFVTGCRAVQRPLDALGLRTDKDFITFVGVDSEADELPFGEERRLWHPEALRKLAPKLKEFEGSYKPHVESACRKLIARLG